LKADGISPGGGKTDPTREPTSVAAVTEDID
jgi:hypothetical protein